MIDRDSPVTEDELHAYIDGELPAPIDPIAVVLKRSGYNQHNMSPSIA